jgi:hypothetical protein
MIGNPSSASRGGEGGASFAFLVVQEKGRTLCLAHFKWMYLRDWRAGGVTLNDPQGNESLESSELEVRTGGVARDFEVTEEREERRDDVELEEARLRTRLWNLAAGERGEGGEDGKETEFAWCCSARSKSRNVLPERFLHNCFARSR